MDRGYPRTLRREKITEGATLAPKLKSSKNASGNIGVVNNYTNNARLGPFDGCKVAD
jgi:hypothetical protein